MSLANVTKFEQIKDVKANCHYLSRDLRQAIKVINADYQQIDFKDQEFLNRVLSKALKTLEAEGI